jgi:hypothetical protein
MNIRTLLSAALISSLLTTGASAQVVPNEVVNSQPPYVTSDNTFSPGGANNIRQINPDYTLNSITSYYGINMPGNLTTALKTMTIFETSTDDLLVFPNPVTGLTRVQLHEPAPVMAFVFIIDMNGQIVTNYQFPAGSLILDVNMGGLPSGLYSVRVFGPYISYHNLKVIKQGSQ